MSYGVSDLNGSETALRGYTFRTQNDIVADKSPILFSNWNMATGVCEAERSSLDFNLTVSHTEVGS